MRNFPIVKGCSYLLAHVPDLVQYGSKPLRDIRDLKVPVEGIDSHLRSFDAVVSYPPNQSYIGNLDPDVLAGVELPWYEHQISDARHIGKYGDIVDEDVFYASLKVADDFEIKIMGVTDSASEYFKSYYYGAGLCYSLFDLVVLDFQLFAEFIQTKSKLEDNYELTNNAVNVGIKISI